MNTLAPYIKVRHGYTVDTSLRKARHGFEFISKVREKLVIPAFDIDNVWRGASEIIKTYGYTLDNNIAFQEIFPIEPPANSNCLLTVMWYPGTDEIRRYKLFEDVGEILWLPLYSGQTIGKPFYIEVWNVNPNSAEGNALGDEEGGIVGEGGIGIGLEDVPIGTDITTSLGSAIEIYSSRLIVPTSKCDLGDISTENDFECVDPVYHLDDFQPQFGDYYDLVKPCERQLIKGVVQQPIYNLLKNRDDDTWHEVWMYVDPVTLAVQLEIYPDNITPPSDALGYFPMTPINAIGTILKFELCSGPDGTGNYFVFDTESVIDAGINVVLLENGASPSPSVLYGFYLKDNGYGGTVFEVIQNQI